MSDSNFHPNEELEQHLRAALRDYAPEAGEQLWAGIEAKLPDRHRRRPMLFWWLTGVGVAAMLTGMAYRFGGNPSTVSAALVAEMHQKEDIFSADKASSLGIAEARLLNLQGLVNVAAPVRLRNLGGLVNVASAQKEALAPSTVLEKTPINFDGATPTQPINPIPITLLVLDIQPGSMLPAMSAQPPSIQPLPFPAKTSRTRRWQIGITAAPVWIWQSATMDGPYHAGQMSFSEHHKGPATGWQKGVAVGCQLAPNWRLAIGLSQRKTSQSSSHTATLRLMDGICLNPNDPGPKEYEFQYVLQSGGSESNVTVRIAQVDTAVTMPADEPFTLAMRTKRRSADWVLPLAIQRTFGRDRWQGFVQAGGQLDLPARTAVQVEHFTEECVDLCFATGRIPTLTLTEHRKASVSWLLGLGLEYRVAPRWGLSFAPTFFGKKGQMGLSLNAEINFKL